MTYRGHVRNGKITLDEPVALPEGVAVNVEIIEQKTDAAERGPSIWDKLLELAGSVDGPEDWARNHDHYIHGTPKKS